MDSLDPLDCQEGTGDEALLARTSCLSRARFVFLPLASVVEKIVGGLQAARPTLCSLAQPYTCCASTAGAYLKIHKVSCTPRFENTNHKLT